MIYGIGPSAGHVVATTARIAPLAQGYGNAVFADMSKRKKARAKGCRRVKGGACLCNGKFARKARCRR